MLDPIRALQRKDTTPADGRTVRYRVRERTFVNGMLVEPKTPDGADNFVMSTPGLEGPALELAPDPSAAKPAAAKDKPAA